MTLAAHVNAGFSIVDTPLATIRGADNHGVSDDGPVIDLTGNDPVLPEKCKKTSSKICLMIAITVAMTGVVG